MKVCSEFGLMAVIEGEFLVSGGRRFQNPVDVKMFLER